MFKSLRDVVKLSWIYVLSNSIVECLFPFILANLILFSRSIMSDSATPWAAACQASLSITISRSWLKFMSIKLVMPSNHRVFCSSFSFCLQSFPASGSLPMSWLFTSGGQNIGASASVSVLPMNIQGWFHLGLTGWISLLSKGLPRVSQTPQFKSINSSALSLLYGSIFTSIHDYWENHSFDYMDICWQSNVSAF